MRRSAFICWLLLVSSAAKAQLITWSPSSFSGDAVRAQVSGGPWTLGSAAYPAPNTGTSNFEPDYQPQVWVDASGTLQGIFDYRPESLEESVLAASSTDGIHWTFVSEALDYADAGTDDGQGHPFAMAVGAHLYLYTLDRTETEVDVAQLLINELNPVGDNPLAGLPAMQIPVPAPGAAGSVRTTGLFNPDGIIGVVPGSNPVEILYVQKQLAIANGADLTTVRLATTVDGIDFEDQGPVTGLIDSCTAHPSTCVTSSSVTYVASRGTLFAITNSSSAVVGYGLLFSAGLWGEDSDAYHYVGYAESTDLTAWTVYNGLGDAPNLPLISIDGNDLTPTGQNSETPLSWYQSRAYGPSAVADSTGCGSLNLIFSGYSGSAKKTTDYRQVGQVSLDLSASGVCVRVEGVSVASQSASGATTGAATTTSSTTTSGTTSGASTSGATTTTAGTTSSGASATTGAASQTTSATAATGTTSGSGSAASTTTTGATTGGSVSTTSSGAIPSGPQGPGCSTGLGASAWLTVFAALGLRRRR